MQERRKIIIRIKYYRLKKEHSENKNKFLEIKNKIWKNSIKIFEGKIEKVSQKGEK